MLEKFKMVVNDFCSFILKQKTQQRNRFTILNINWIDLFYFVKNESEKLFFDLLFSLVWELLEGANRPIVIFFKSSEAFLEWPIWSNFSVMSFPKIIRNSKRNRNKKNVERKLFWNLDWNLSNVSCAVAEKKFRKRYPKT